MELDGKPISKMLVKELKEHLEQRNLESKGLKAVLVARLEEALRSDAAAKAKEAKPTAMETEAAKKEERQPNGNNKDAAHQKKKEAEAPAAPTQKVEKKEEAKATEMEVSTPKKQGGSQTPKRGAASAGKRKEQEEPTEPVKEQQQAVEKEKEKEVLAKRQRKWGPTTTDTSAVSTDTLKEIIPAESKQKEPVRQVKPPLAQKEKEVTTSTEGADPEVREVPPAKNPVSNTLYLTNFVRPFTKQQVDELLNQTGKVVQSGMDPIKSRCYAIFETEEGAMATREALHNLVWPPANRAKLNVEFATEEEAKRFFTPGSQQPAEVKPKPRVSENVLTLDDLFKKTTAKPPIYWLPLTDSEVEMKRKITVK